MGGHLFSPFPLRHNCTSTLFEATWLLGLERALQLDQLAGPFLAGAAHPADKDSRADGISPIICSIPGHGVSPSSLLLLPHQRADVERKLIPESHDNLLAVLRYCLLAPDCTILVLHNG